MKTNQKTPKQRRFEKNRLAKIERNKRRRITAKRRMRLQMKEENSES